MIIRLVKKIKRRLSSMGGRNNHEYGRGIAIDWVHTTINNVTFDEFAFVAHHAQISDCSIGRHSSIGRFAKVRETDMGRYCSISWDVTIGAPTHPLNTITSAAVTYRKEYNVVDEDLYFPQKRTKIGHDVWIGCGVTIISGCNIGNGTVIGAGAVVTKDIPPYEIWAGVPARKIGQRFDDEIIEHLQKMEWWNWSVEEIRECLDLFKMSLTMKVVEELERRHYTMRK